jgi:hypothetical protein
MDARSQLSHWQLLRHLKVLFRYFSSLSEYNFLFKSGWIWLVNCRACANGGDEQKAKARLMNSIPVEAGGPAYMVSVQVL